MHDSALYGVPALAGWICNNNGVSGKIRKVPPAKAGTPNAARSLPGA
jgi:hypothetical protein